MTDTLTLSVCGFAGRWTRWRGSEHAKLQFKLVLRSITSIMLGPLETRIYNHVVKYIKYVRIDIAPLALSQDHRSCDTAALVLYTAHEILCTRHITIKLRV